MQGFLDQYGPLLGLVGLSLSLLLAGVVAVLAARLRAVSGRWSCLMKDANGANIESLLRDHLSQTAAVNERLNRSEARQGSLESKMTTAKRFVGVVRFDAFEDVGGAQSFAIAVYDEVGNGAVVTSMVGRADCRVYAKEIRQGKADRELSKEEREAIEAAVIKQPASVRA